MLQIEFYISQSTIELENSRNPDKLSKDELLYWSFEARIDFVQTDSKNSLLLLPEASLFQILKLLSDAKKKTLSGENTEISTRDREGSYDLHIKKNVESLEISDVFNNVKLQIDIKDFIVAVESFKKNTIKEIEEKSPKLVLNNNYRELINSL